MYIYIFISCIYIYIYIYVSCIYRPYIFFFISYQFLYSLLKSLKGRIKAVRRNDLSLFSNVYPVSKFVCNCFYVLVLFSYFLRPSNYRQMGPMVFNRFVYKFQTSYFVLSLKLEICLVMFYYIYRN